MCKHLGKPLGVYAESLFLCKEWGKRLVFQRPETERHYSRSSLTDEGWGRQSVLLSFGEQPSTLMPVPRLCWFCLSQQISTVSRLIDRECSLCPSKASLRNQTHSTQTKRNGQGKKNRVSQWNTKSKCYLLYSELLHGQESENTLFSFLFYLHKLEL